MKNNPDFQIASNKAMLTIINFQSLPANKALICELNSEEKTLVILEKKVTEYEKSSELRIHERNAQIHPLYRISQFIKFAKYREKFLHNFSELKM